MVDVICYGKRDTWNSREEAKKFYFDGMMCCDGSERNRYMNVYIALVNGDNVCSDGFPERKDVIQ